MEEINYLPLQSAKRFISGVVWGGEQGWREREALKISKEMTQITYVQSRGYIILHT